MKRLSLIFCSGFGVGYFPWAPGTVGTLWGIPLYYFGRNIGLAGWCLGTVIFTFLAIGLSHFAEKQIGDHDSSIIVIDEVAGYLVTVAGITFSWESAILAFVLFRFFDIVKPFPVRWIDRKIKGAWGVVLDDIMAGVYANLCLRLALYFWEG